MKKIISSLIIAAAVLSANAAGQIKWHSADSLPLIGKAVDDASTSNRYQRIPDSLLHTVRNGALAGLGRNSAGMALRFAAKTGRVDVKWHTPFKTLMNHQTPTGSRGLDLYTLMPDGTWTFVNSARPNVNSHDSQANVISNMTPVMREYLLYLPLYDGVDSLYIGLDEDALLLQPSDVFHADKPIIMYGTSILQGGCANRAGMAHTNILARRLNREVINLGFSGNGQLDLEIARVIAAVPDPGLIVLDFVPNVNEEQIDTLMIPFFEIIRSAHPDVPFLFIEDPNFPHKRFDHAARKQVDTRNAMMKERYEKLAAKYGNLHYLPADHLIGTDNEATVDGIHFTDLGFLRFADLLQPIVERIALPLNEKVATPEPVVNKPTNNKPNKKRKK